MNEIKAVFYDLDNTLYPQIMDVRQRVEHCIREYLDGDLECIKKFWVNEWLDNGLNKSDIIDRVIQKFPSSVKKEEIISAYRSCQTTLHMETDILRTLRKIKKREIKQFIITNGCPEVQLCKINALGIKDIFNDIVTATGAYAKPSPYWYEKLLQKYNLTPEKCLSIGDWYEIDGTGAIAVGIQFIKVNSGPVKENIPAKTRCINKLAEIEEYLQL